ncbi:MAG: DUF5654 family protein [Candidatus Pacearchaeota archaeon]
MDDGISVGGIVKTSLVTALTIAAALVWKDVFTHTIEILFPGEILFYQFIGAIIATVLVVLVIYVVLKTESRAEILIRDLTHVDKKKRKKIIKEIKEAERKNEKRKYRKSK